MASLEVKQVGDTTIYVNDQGKFYAEIDGKTVQRASLNSLERLITQRLSPLRVIIPERKWDWHVSENEIIRTVGDKLKGKNSSYDRWDEVYLYDEEAVAEFQKLLMQYDDLSDRWDAVVGRLTRVTYKNFEKLRADES